MNSNDQANVLLKQYQARIDRDGWSDDLCLEIIQQARREAFEEALENANSYLEEQYELSQHIIWLRQRAQDGA